MLDPEEDLSSDSSDEDYVPQHAEVSEEEESGEEEVPEGEEEGKGKKTKKSKGKKNEGKGKRKGGIRLEDDDNEAVEDEEEKRDLDKEMAEEREEKKEEMEKKRVDDLFADFMKDVGQPSRPKPVASVSKTTVPEKKVVTVPSPAVKRPVEDKVTITKVFDFAGETVKVTKEVAATSKEAKAAEKPAEEASEKPASSPVTTGVKRPGGGLGNVLSMIGKKQKISTLEKSKLDWNKFKQDEGISEELQIHNRGKDGFIERKNFLERADLRQFEIEKNVRLANSSKR